MLSPHGGCYWSYPTDVLLANLCSSREGLSDDEAAKRLAAHDPNVVARRSTTSVLKVLARQFRSSLIFVLLAARRWRGGIGHGLRGRSAVRGPTKADLPETLSELQSLGVSLKIITGDNRYTALHIAQAVGMASPHLITGEELQMMRDEALWQRASHVDVFAEVDPNQKERIILALRKQGNVVGYIGDGINDAPALHAADVGISVDSAVEVAKEAADMLLLEHDLRVVNLGIRQGRATFANTQKYILSTTSANFGNMLSMAAASAFLPFLPLLAPQILLNNLLTDIPAVSLAGDRVDSEYIQRPPRWSMRRIRRFTIAFGCLSSVFDLLTFALLLWLFGASAERFRGGWFLASLTTEVLVLFAIRTQRPLLASSPSPVLTGLSVLVILAALALVQTPVGRWLGFVPLHSGALLALGAITLAYVASVELVKRPLYRLTAPLVNSAPIS